MIDVVAAIIEDDGQFLACRRRIERVAGGLWEFPGGKVEAGESPEQALVREIAEELSVEVDRVRHFTTVDKGDLRLIFMWAQLVGSRPTISTDHDRLEWISAARLRSLSWAPADQVAVGRLIAREEDLKAAVRPYREDYAELGDQLD